MTEHTSKDLSNSQRALKELRELIFAGELPAGSDHLESELAARLVEAGVDELGLSDTVGYASPKSVKSLIRKVRAVAGDDKVKSVHLHNTYGLGIANAFAAF